MRARRRDHQPGKRPDAQAGQDRSRDGGESKGQQRRGRNRSGGGDQGAPDRASQRGPGRSGGRRKNRKRRPKLDPMAFWGDPAQLPRSEADVRITDDPGAVPRSLGTPPLPGQEQLAPHYFAAVYDRAVTTAGALAAAGGLIDTETLTEELGD
jgi:hypothetical protein